MYLKASHAGRNLDLISPLAACRAPLDAMRDSPYGGGFQLSSGLIPPSSQSNCGLSSKTVFREANQCNGNS